MRAVISVCFILIFACISPAKDKLQFTVQELYDLGKKEEKKGNYEEAIKYLEILSIALKGFKDNESYRDLLTVHLAPLYFKMAGKAVKELNYNEAVVFYTKILKFETQEGRKENQRIMLLNIAHTNQLACQWQEAIDSYKKAYNISKEIDDFSSMAISNNGIAMIYSNLCRYDEAIEIYQRNLPMIKKTGNKRELITVYNNIGIVYNAWGKYENAIGYFTISLKISEDIGNKELILGTLINLGTASQYEGKYGKAMGYVKRALVLLKTVDNVSMSIAVTNLIASVYRTLDQEDLALDYYKKALEMTKKINNKEDLLNILSNIGSIYYDRSEFEKALEYFKKAYVIAVALEKNDKIEKIVSYIGSVYFSLGDLKKAEECFLLCIEIIEIIRQTAVKEIKRVYLETRIGAYNDLVATYIKAGKHELAFDTIELASSKNLGEEIAIKANLRNFKFQGVLDYQKNKLDKNTTIVNYSNIDWANPAQIVVNSGIVHSFFLNRKRLIKRINLKYREEISERLKNLPGGKSKKFQTHRLQYLDEEKTKFKRIVNFYRLLLSKQYLTKTDVEMIDFFGKEFYRLLFGNIESYIKGEQLLIIPDGILALIPFEALVMPDGSYLVEKYDIKYSHSLTIMELIGKRKYPDTREPLLAFGGANYGSESGNLEKLRWADLPSTRREVRTLGELIKKAKILKGSDASEHNVKTMSINGALRNYRILHFATHGFADSDSPELSALVLSLDDEHQDGYLRMKEILGLNIEADFVNLSACESGLGKIFSGEGVVGLSQAFLLAGANGISVSLWQVSDESTKKFMVGVYKLVVERNLSYAAAISEMKRFFIADREYVGKYNPKRGIRLLKDKGVTINKYSNPFFWAPFVYFGE